VGKFLRVFGGLPKGALKANLQMTVPKRFTFDCRGLATAMGRELWLEGRPIARLSGNRAKDVESPMFLVFLSIFALCC
jgi:hypothetical protein